MSDEPTGIYRKYNVTRTDGSSACGKKHEHCSYFVLDIEHDPFAIAALDAYAKACAATHPDLCADICEILSRERAREMEERVGGFRGLTASQTAARLMEINKP